MPRRLVLTFLLAALAGCAKPDLPATVVHAGSPGELTALRAELGGRFPAGQLAAFDTALKELKLDAMNRGVATADARERDLLAAINGKSVRETEILGWQARRSRLLGEIKLMSGLLERDLQRQRETAATGTPESVTTHLQNEREILDRLQRDLAETEARLAAWAR
jgi:hypothetical protein